MKFYNLKARTKVDVPDNKVETHKYEITTSSGKKQVRYALKAEVNGQKLTKFVNEETYKQYGGK